MSVGIAKDSDIRAGLTHLEKFGTFDEVMTGRNWINTGVLKYVYSDLPGPGATPQILVVDRHVTNDANGVRIKDETVTIRRIGLRELREWSEGGVDPAVPDLSSQAPAPSAGREGAPVPACRGAGCS